MCEGEIFFWIAASTNRLAFIVLLLPVDGGYAYDCTRDDGLPFYGATLDIKYRAV